MLLNPNYVWVFLYICEIMKKNTTNTKGEQKKYERTFVYDDCIVIWKYDNYKTTSGPYEVEVKNLPKKG